MNGNSSSAAQRLENTHSRDGGGDDGDDGDDDDVELGACANPLCAEALGTDSRVRLGDDKNLYCVYCAPEQGGNMCEIDGSEFFNFNAAAQRAGLDVYHAEPAAKPYHVQLRLLLTTPAEVPDDVIDGNSDSNGNQQGTASAQPASSAVAAYVANEDVTGAASAVLGAASGSHNASGIPHGLQVALQNESAVVASAERVNSSMKMSKETAEVMHESVRNLWCCLKEIPGTVSASDMYTYEQCAAAATLIEKMAKKFREMKDPEERKQLFPFGRANKKRLAVRDVLDTIGGREHFVRCAFGIRAARKRWHGVWDKAMKRVKWCGDLRQCLSTHTKVVSLDGDTTQRVRNFWRDEWGIKPNRRGAESGTKLTWVGFKRKR